MTAITSPAVKGEYAGHLRKLDLKRDLMVVADLVELCFADTLDVDGRRYVNQMRQQANKLQRPTLSSNDPMGLDGFVWEENGRIVGNLNLIPITVMRRRAFLIANVAVHPQYRQRGIARWLTLAALEEIQRKKVDQAWLQVNANNEAAKKLYQSADFQEALRRTTWHSCDEEHQGGEKTGVKISPRHWGDWPLQRQWLRSTYPGQVSWHLPIDLNLLRPGMSGVFNRLLDDRQLRQWSARVENELIGVITWQSSSLQADWLWLAAAPEHEERAIQSLLSFAHETLSKSRKLAINYPGERYPGAFQEAGFEAHETLIWMQRRV